MSKSHFQMSCQEKSLQHVYLKKDRLKEAISTQSLNAERYSTVEIQILKKWEGLIFRKHTFFAEVLPGT